VDYDKSNVWLCDPTSDYSLGLITCSRRKWIKEKYNIDCKIDKPHNNIGFKYPIPFNPKANRPLYWLNEKVKKSFFEILISYNPLRESLRPKPHPFTFVTSSGNRLDIKSVHKSFKQHCLKLQESYPEYNLSALGLHSLRHMYGVYMADLFSMAVEGKVNIPPDKIKIYCQHGMGHKSAKSTDIYFNMRFERETQLGSKLISEYVATNKIAISFINETTV